MYFNFSDFKIFLRPSATDGRKSFNSLVELVITEMDLDVYDRNLFLFCNKRKNLLKILFWDRNVFWLCSKRLEKDKFPWLYQSCAKIELTEEQLSWLLRGIDFFQAHEELKYTIYK